MATTPYSTFLPEVAPFVFDVPEFVATNAVRNACIEFCEKTRYLQLEVPTFDTVVNQPNYNIATLAGLTSDQIFVDMMESWNGGALLIPKSSEELTRLFRWVDWRTQIGMPIYITRILQNEVLLVPVPQAISTITMRIAVAPSRASLTVDNEIFEHFVEFISYGARARLYDMPNQPFFDRAAAELYEQKFRAAISAIRIKVNKGLSRASVAAEFQRFV